MATPTLKLHRTALPSLRLLALGRERYYEWAMVEATVRCGGVLYALLGSSCDRGDGAESAGTAGGRISVHHRPVPSI